MKKRAILSVSNKEGIADFAKGLVNLGFEICSTAERQKFWRKRYSSNQSFLHYQFSRSFFGACKNITP